MFGEDLILGYKKCRIDDKHRLFLPKFSFSEKGDSIAISEDENGIILLSNIISLKQKIASLEKSVGSSENMKSLELLYLKLERLYVSCLATSKVDSQRRMLIPEGVYDKHKINDTVILQGCGDHLKVFDNEESHNEYVRKLNSSRS